MIVFGYAKDIAPTDFIVITPDYILRQDWSNTEILVKLIRCINKKPPLFPWAHYFFPSLQSYRYEETTSSPLPAPKTIFCMNRLHTLMLALPPYNKQNLLTLF